MGSVKGFFSKPIFLIILACIIPNLGGFLGSLFTNDSLQTWFKTLIKPSFNPPGWLFGPVWTILYTSMGYASYRVWSRGGGFSGEAKVPLIFYIIQLLINWSWTPIFFGARELLWSSVVISIMLVFIIITTVLFFRVDKIAGFLLVPYIAWVSFATVLNISLWHLNKDQQ